MRAVWGPRMNHQEQLLALDHKTIISEKHKFLTKWKYHFATLLHEMSTMEQYAVDNIEQKLTQHWMYEYQDLNK